MKPSAEFKAFDVLMEKVLSVSHEEIKRREAEYRKQAAMNPRKRGPKPRVRPSTSDHAEGAR